MRYYEQVKRQFIWIISLIVIYRIVIVWLNPIISWDQDSLVYGKLAKNLFLFGRYGMGKMGGSAWFMPGYPIFLATIFKFFGSGNYLAVRLIQQGLGVIAAILVGKVSAKIWGAKAELWSLTLAGFYPPFLFIDNQIYTEAIYGVLLIGWFYLWMKTEKGTTAWVCGMLLGLSLIVRPVLFWVVPGIIVFYILKRNWQRLKLTIIMGLGTALILLPWWIRNYQLMGKWVTFSLQGGEVILGGTYYGYNYENDLPNWPTGSEWQQNKDRTSLAKIRTINQIQNETGKWLVWQLKKGYLLWSAPFYRDSRGLPPYKIVWLEHVLILILAIGALFKKTVGRETIRIVVILIVMTLLHMATVGLDRYNLPLMYLVIVLSGKFLADLL